MFLQTEEFGGKKNNNNNKKWVRYRYYGQQRLSLLYFRVKGNANHVQATLDWALAGECPNKYCHQATNKYMQHTPGIPC